MLRRACAAPLSQFVMLLDGGVYLVFKRRVESELGGAGASDLCVRVLCHAYLAVAKAPCA